MALNSIRTPKLMRSRHGRTPNREKSFPERARPNLTTGRSGKVAPAALHPSWGRRDDLTSAPSPAAHKIQLSLSLSSKLLTYQRYSAVVLTSIQDKHRVCVSGGNQVNRRTPKWFDHSLSKKCRWRPEDGSGSDALVEPIVFGLFLLPVIRVADSLCRVRWYQCVPRPR